jgi:hypothetical protein
MKQMVNMRTKLQAYQELQEVDLKVGMKVNKDMDNIESAALMK